MRFNALFLKAFGPFTNHRFDLSGGHFGLHVVYGPNEAGKSSALRALKALLYGIPPQTNDNFRHEYSRLRVGATLLLSSGESLTCFRRKGNKDTLLDESEQPLDEAVLQRFLKGVDGDSFSNLFGLSHDTLVRGGAEILEGKGAIGESLFASGLGSNNLHRVIQDLDSEALELFRPRGHNQEINRAIKEYGILIDRIKELNLAPSTWKTHDQTLREARGERDQVRGNLHTLQAELTRLRRLHRSLPLLVQRQSLLDQLEAQRETIRLPASFTRERERAQETLVKTTRGLEQVREELDRIEQEYAKLEISDAMLERAALIEGLFRRLGSIEKAAQDRMRHEGQQRGLRNDIRRLLSQLKLEAEVEGLEALRLSTADRSQLQELGNQHSALEQAVIQATRDRTELELEQRARFARLAALPPPRDLGPLQMSLELVSARGDLEAQLLKARQLLKQQREELDRGLARLPLWKGTPEELEALPLPELATLERFDTDFQALDREQETVEAQRNAARSELRDLLSRLQTLRLQGKVPTFEELEATRSQRDVIWLELKPLVLDLPPPDLPREQRLVLVSSFEVGLHSADDQADSLRHDADRVAQAATLRIQELKHQQMLEQAERGIEALVERRIRLQTAWLDRWTSCHIEPQTPREMRAWLEQHARLLTRCGELRARASECEALADQAQRLEAELRTALEQAGVFMDADKPLNALLARARAELKIWETEQQTRRELERDCSEGERRLTKLLLQLEDANSRLAAWRTAWKRALERLRLEADSTPSAVNAVLVQFDELFKRFDELQSLERRLFGIDKEREEFVLALAPVLETLAPELCALPPEDGAGQLHARLKRAQTAEDRRKELKIRLDDKRDQAAQLELNLRQCDETLAALCVQAGCAQPEALPELEQQSANVLRCQQELVEVERRLMEQGDGLSIGELVREAAEVERDTLPGHIQELSRQVEELDAARTLLDQTIGREAAELSRMDGRSEAARVAEDAQSQLALIGGKVKRYVRLRLAHQLLNQEIERYRKEHQGPLLGRASTLFSALTLGSFSGLNVGYLEKDQRVLEGQRSSGELVRVDGMSDGTRDQLYLALRLASLEHFVRHQEPIPLILDDILVHFDEPRSAAALRVLGDVSRSTQILLFTHHQRVLELAQAALPAEQLFVHRLEP